MLYAYVQQLRRHSVGRLTTLARKGQQDVQSWTTALSGGTGRVTSKEEGLKDRGDLTRVRSLMAHNGLNTVRLLQAMESHAPGAWSDDRYEQTLRHFVGINYVAIHRICVQLSRAEFQVFRSVPDHPDGKIPVSRLDPAYELVELLQRPNPQDSFGKLMYRWGQQRRLTGTALSWAPQNRLGKPYRLFSIPTCTAIPQPTVTPDFPDGYYRIQPVYPYGPFSMTPGANTSVGAAIDSRSMLRMSYPHPFLRYDGYSPLTGMRLHIDALEMIDKARHYMMRRGMFPNAVLNSTDAEGANEINDDELERLRAMFEEDHQGPENWGRLFIAYAGWKLEKWGDPPSEMAFEGGWEQLTSFILGGGFGITKPAAGMVEDSSYATLFATMKQLHLVTLEPECEEIGSELTRFLGPYWGNDIIVDVRVPRIDDHEVKFAKLDRAVAGKCITKNEMRKELGFSLTKEPWGGDFAGDENIPTQETLMMMSQMAPQIGPDGQPLGPPPGAPMENPLESASIAQGDEDGMAPREGPGDLGEGSLGPRPGTVQRIGKHLYVRRKLVTNGKH